ncbi:MAG: hypothetical protein LUE29_09640 [Lachnospiraceae bacterium]|nr:hypothetical protein [Lachnospiraceae bacterium]
MGKYEVTLSLPYNEVSLPTEDSLRTFVKLALRQRGISVRQLARDLKEEGGPCEKQIHRWLYGENSMRYKSIEKIFRYLIVWDEAKEV